MQSNADDKPQDQRAPRGDIMNGRRTNDVFAKDKLENAYTMHRHGGQSVLDGNFLYGPYFIIDSSDGHTYKITCTAGVLGTVLVK
jgi:hypothetical protein